MKQSTGCDCCTCAPNSRVEDTSHARRLEYLTIGWNLIEGALLLELELLPEVLHSSDLVLTP